MPATSRTWRSTRSMLAAWSPLRRAGAPAGEQWLRRPGPLQIIFPRGKNQPVHTFSSRPFRRWLCLIHNDREVGAVVEQVAAVQVVAAAGAGAPGEGGRGGGARGAAGEAAPGGGGGSGAGGKGARGGAPAGGGGGGTGGGPPGATKGPCS